MKISYKQYVTEIPGRLCHTFFLKNELLLFFWDPIEYYRSLIESMYADKAEFLRSRVAFMRGAMKLYGTDTVSDTDTNSDIDADADIIVNKEIRLAGCGDIRSRVA